MLGFYTIHLKGMLRLNNKVKKYMCALLTGIICTNITACGNAVNNTYNTLETEITADAIITPSIDCYKDNDFAVPDGFDRVRDDVEYGTYQEGLFYYSSAIDAKKEFTIILPAGYSTSEQYPVIYALHGFGLFKGECTGCEQRASYDRFADDLEKDLMPYIEANYSVKKGRDNTAIIGMSQGGTEALAIGFLMQDKIGYIGSLAPCPGVIPTEFYKGSYWNVPILEDFIIDNEETAPHYILLTVGSLDPWDIPCTQYYDQVMTQKGIEHQYYMLDGGDHTYETWAHSLYNFARRIFPNK